MKKIPYARRTLERAMTSIQAEKRAELKKLIPPWCARKELAGNCIERSWWLLYPIKLILISALSYGFLRHVLMRQPLM